jgi:hypothetical protein
VHEPQQREQDPVHQAVDAEHRPEEAHRQPVLEPIDRLFEIGPGDEVRQDMLDERLCLPSAACRSTPAASRAFVWARVSMVMAGFRSSRILVCISHSPRRLPPSPKERLNKG